MGWIEIHFLLAVISSDSGSEPLNPLKNGSMFPKKAEFGRCILTQHSLPGFPVIVNNTGNPGFIELSSGRQRKQATVARRYSRLGQAGLIEALSFLSAWPPGIGTCRVHPFVRMAP